jgi:DNA repair exonuclease SbcCD nuclease subunit
MRVMHLADLHLGYRQFQRSTSGGLNQREADVSQAFQRAIDITIARAPELVVVAGDVFHTVRPSNPAILHATSQLLRLRHALPDAIVIVIGGNHDTPRCVEAGCLLGLFSSLGVHVADVNARRIDFVERDLSVLAVPETISQRPAFAPNASARWNVLVAHLAVTDVCPVGHNGLSASLDDLGPDRWSYVALGHYHVCCELAPNAGYAGSIEYTSTNPWGELAEEARRGVPGKGIVEFDLETGARTFHPITPARQIIDLPPIDARSMAPAELDAAIATNASSVEGGIRGVVARQVIFNVTRELTRDLNHRAIRALKAEALHYQLDTRKSDPIAGERTGRTTLPSLEEMLRVRLEARMIASDLPREKLIELGMEYLSAAAALGERAVPIDIDSSEVAA